MVIIFRCSRINTVVSRLVIVVKMLFAQLTSRCLYLHEIVTELVQKSIAIILNSVAGI